MNIIMETKINKCEIKHKIFLCFIDYQRFRGLVAITIFGYRIYKCVGVRHQFLWFTWTY